MKQKALLGRVSDVDIRLLRVFHAVTACGGVAAAELELNIGRSTISRHLTDLETRLGVKLCDRGPGGFALSDEGQRVLEASMRLMSAIDNFQSDINEVHRRLTGHLSIALFDKNTSNPKAQLPRAIMLFEEIAPNVTMELHTRPVNTIESGILSGEFHLGIIPAHRQSNSLDYYPLYAEQMFLYCSEEHPLFDCPDRKITRREILNFKYAGIGFHSPNMVISHKLGFQRSADVYDEESLAALILSGCYIGFLPDHFADRFTERGQLRRLRPDLFHYQSDHTVIVRRSPRPSRLTLKFLDCLRRAHE
jgi:DNA-binding transcriptional LysR family regulator